MSCDDLRDANSRLSSYDVSKVVDDQLTRPVEFTRVPSGSVERAALTNVPVGDSAKRGREKLGRVIQPIIDARVAGQKAAEAGDKAGVEASRKFLADVYSDVSDGSLYHALVTSIEQDPDVFNYLKGLPLNEASMVRDVIRGGLSGKGTTDAARMFENAYKRAQLERLSDTFNANDMLRGSRIAAEINTRRMSGYITDEDVYKLNLWEHIAAGDKELFALMEDPEKWVAVTRAIGHVPSTPAEIDRAKQLYRELTAKEVATSDLSDRIVKVLSDPDLPASTSAKLSVAYDVSKSTGKIDPKVVAEAEDQLRRIKSVDISKIDESNSARIWNDVTLNGADPQAGIAVFGKYVDQVFADADRSILKSPLTATEMNFLEKLASREIDLTKDNAQTLSRIASKLDRGTVSKLAGRLRAVEGIPEEYRSGLSLPGRKGHGVGAAIAGIGLAATPAMLVIYSVMNITNFAEMSELFKAFASAGTTEEMYNLIFGTESVTINGKEYSPDQMRKDFFRALKEYREKTDWILSIPVYGDFSKLSCFLVLVPMSIP